MLSKIVDKKDWINDVTVYHNKKESIITRFDSTEYLLWEQKYKDQMWPKGDFK